MKEKLTKQEVAEAKKLAKAIGQMKKKFKKALIEETLLTKANNSKTQLN